MTEHRVRLPDVGEGVAEAEIVEWLVVVGERVTTETAIAEVMTDKATVEISAPVSGIVTFLYGQPGDRIAVGTEIVGIDTGDGVTPDAAPRPMSTTPPPRAATDPGTPATTPATMVERWDPPPLALPSREPEVSRRPMAAPTVRQRARALGIDLATVSGSGPLGRIVLADLDRHGDRSSRRAQPEEPRLEPVRGLRRRIAERLSTAWAEIPHITYVEEIDATDVDLLRREMNRDNAAPAARLTLLPFIIRSIVIACRDQPRFNATYDSAEETLSLFDAVHVGIATQTPAGLVVPVVRHAEGRGIRDLATEVARVAGAAREGTATRDELSGSTITISSLGALGGLMTTPIINRPEVAIVGVNKLQTRPVWRDGTFVPRSVCNLSSSFDHRIIDGWDAAKFVQRIKVLLEMPALLFLDGE